MSKIRIYSPVQVWISSFFGGPLAAVYVLWRNFASLGNGPAAAKTATWGTLAVLAFILVLPFIPDNIPVPRLIVPIAYTAMATVLADRYQLKKQAIAESEKYEFQSAANVVGITIGAVVAFLVSAAAWVLAADYLGIAKLD